MENGVVTVLYFLQKKESNPSSHERLLGHPIYNPPSSRLGNFIFVVPGHAEPRNEFSDTP